MTIREATTQYTSMGIIPKPHTWNRNAVAISLENQTTIQCNSHLPQLHRVPISPLRVNLQFHQRRARGRVHLPQPTRSISSMVTGFPTTTAEGEHVWEPPPRPISAHLPSTTVSSLSYTPAFCPSPRLRDRIPDGLRSNRG